LKCLATDGAAGQEVAGNQRVPLGSTEARRIAQKDLEIFGRRVDWVGSGIPDSHRRR
jgi:hypothetical protein